MGRLSQQRRQGRGPRPRSNGAKKGPLRKIVGRRHVVGDLWYEILECGHEQRPVRDLMGETNAVRRRCARCRKESGS